MILSVTRKPSEGDAIPGDLYVDGVWECFTLERQGVEIPPGTYPVLLTTSDRVRKGTLWSPRKDASLPLIHPVPGRTGIRIHAGNSPKDTEGCVLVGKIRGEVPGQIHTSRQALTTLIEKISQARKSVQVVIR